MKKSRLLPALFWRKLAGEHLSHEQLPHDRSFAHVSRRQNSNTHLHIEQLEDRMMLSISPVDYTQVSAAWFASGLATDSSRMTASANNVVSAVLSTNSASAETSTRWIVRLTPEALQNAPSVADAAVMFSECSTEFQVLCGLGLPGQVLIQASGSDLAAVEATLRANPAIASFECDSTVSSQTVPNDPSYASQWDLDNSGQSGGIAGADIDAERAWGVTTGSRTVVVGVIDSGVDYNHPDLYQNIWINQAEIPTTLRSSLTDSDNDKLITLWDLNQSENSTFVSDLNQNGYIDAGDLLADPRWADGTDSDTNSFIDDLVGYNFQANTNNPFDDNGHGTHVAGTIGAMGNDGVGVTGINWNTSLMDLKFLDATNIGLTSNAIRAINYATMMRTRATNPVNVRILNASWGNIGSYSTALHDAIATSATADMLFVAAAGNGDVLNRGINTDDQAFYPAGYDCANIVAVAATDQFDHLTRFSNYGANSVDLAAPGIGILSTAIDGAYATQNGTSMAAPHVSGSAALVWASVPWAHATEIRAALLKSVDPIGQLQGKVASGGRLNAYGTLVTDTIAPMVELVSAMDVTTPGGTYEDITIRYTDNTKLLTATLDNNDLLVTQLHGTGQTFAVTLVLLDQPTDNDTITAVYRMAAPGGTWGVFNSGEYQISLQPNQAKDLNNNYASATVLGVFHVALATDHIFSVDSLLDTTDANPGDGLAKDAEGHTTLRAAIQEANALSGPSTIYLDPGNYTLTIQGMNEDAAATGDLDITGQITISGVEAAGTVIDGNDHDRVFDVRSGGVLNLSHVTVTGGRLTGTSEGVAIRNLGQMTIDNCVVRDNGALGVGGDEFRVNMATDNPQINPDIAMDAAGNYVVVWMTQWQPAGQSGANYADWGQRYAAGGTPLGSEFQIGSTVTVQPVDRANAWRPSVAMNAAGDFVVTWVGYDPEQSWEIFAQRFAADGTLLETPQVVNSQNHLNQCAPVAAMDAAGNFVIVWEDWTADINGTTCDVMARQYNAVDAVWGDEFSVSTSSYLLHTAPAVAMRPDGEFVISWIDNGTAIQAQWFDASAVRVGTEFRTDDSSGYPKASVGLNVSSSGNFVIAWDGPDSQASRDVYLHLYSSPGNAAGPVSQVNIATYDRQIQPAVAFGPDGNYLVAWSDYAGLDSSGAAVYAQWYSPVGAALGPQFHANTSFMNDQCNPQIAIGPSGEPCVVWQGSGSGDYDGIFARFLPPPTQGTITNDGTLVLSGSTVSGNMAAEGAGLLNNGTLTVTQTTVSDNQATGHGGGLFNMGIATISATTFSGNNADGNGGGIYNVNTVALANCTVSGNKAAIQGGGIFNLSAAASTLNNCTIADNSAKGDGIALAPKKLGVETLINTSTAGNQAGEVIAMDSAGNYVVVWVSQHEGQAAVFGQLYFADGRPRGGEFRVNDASPDPLSAPYVAMDPFGNFIVTWSGSGTDTNGSGIAVKCYWSDGSLRKTQFCPCSYEMGDQEDPVIAIAADGSFVIVWVDKSGLDGSGAGIFARRFSAAGDPQGGQFQVNTFTTEDQLEPSIGIRPNGDFVIAWTDYSAYYVHYWQINIEARRFNAIGQPQGQEFLVNTTTWHDQFEPTVTVDAEGGFVILWESRPWDPEYNGGIYAQRYDASGLPQGCEFWVDNCRWRAFNVSAAMNVQGEFVVVWEAGGLPFARRFNRFAQPLEAAFQVSDSVSYNYSLHRKRSVALNDRGDFVMVWDGAGPRDSSGVFSQRFTGRAYDGGGVYNSTGVTFNLKNTLIGGNTAVHESPDLYGTVSSQGHNLVGDAVGAAGLQTDVATPTAEFSVNAPGSYTKTAATIGYGDQGNFLVAWESWRQGVWQIYGCEYGNNGNPLGDEFLISDGAGHRLEPVVGGSSAGRFVVAWSGAEIDGPGDPGIGYSVYAADGTRVIGPTAVPTDGTGSQDQPAVSIDANGDFVIAWTDESGQDGNGLGVFAQRFNAAGVAQGARILVNQTTAGNQNRPSVTMADDGNFVVVWQDYAHPGVACDIYARRFRPDGTPDGDEFRVNMTTDDDQLYPAVAADADGDFVVVWQSADPSSTGIYAQRYDAAGTPQGTEFLVNTYLTGAQQAPSVSMDSTGNFLITWNSDGQDGSGSGVYGQRFDQLGVAVGVEFRVNTTTSGEQSSNQGRAVAMDSHGNAIIVWTGNGPGDAAGVFAARYLANPPETIVNTSTIGVQSSAVVAADSVGNSLVVWQGPQNDKTGILGRRLAASGRVLGSDFLISDIAATGDSTQASVAMNSAGASIVAWTVAGLYGTGTSGVEWSLYGTDGTLLSGHQTVPYAGSGGQGDAAVGIDPAGNFVVLWTDDAGGGVYAQRYNAVGVAQGSKFLVAEGGYQAAVAKRADHSFVATWTAVGTIDGSQEVFARVFASDGTPLRETILVNNTTAEDQRCPAIAADPAGTFLIVWQSDDMAGSGEDWNIYGQHFNAFGNRIGPEFRINSWTADQETAPSLGMDSHGYFTIAWNSQNEDGDGSGLFARRYNSMGDPLGDRFRVNPTLQADQSNTTGEAMAVTSAGELILVWDGNGPGDTSGIFATWFRSSDHVTDTVTARLGPLADNGGPTMTHALLSGSPAIDAGDNLGAPTTDQRGIARPQDADGDGKAVVDIGAFERYHAGVEGVVFRDLNGNGVRDAGDVGIAGVTVYLDLNGNGSFDSGEHSSVSRTDELATLNIDESGTYDFSQLPPGDYIVREVLPSGWNKTYPIAGSYTVSLALGQSVGQLDFGNFARPGQLYGSLFNDLDEDGFRDTAEPGLANWVVYLDANHNGVWDLGEAWIATDSSGIYSFTNLQPLCTYTLRTIVPEDWALTWPRQTNSGQWTITLAPGTALSNLDFGAYDTTTTGQSNNATLSGIEFLDGNRNRVQDAGEAGMAGWTVYLDINDNGVLDTGEPTTTTNASGVYTFTGLGAGMFVVRPLTTTGSLQTSPLGNQLAATTVGTGKLGQTQAIAEADFNNDGYNDLAVANGNIVSILINNTHGVFSTMKSILLDGITPVYGAYAVLAGDFNGDGMIDLAVANYLSSNVSIVKNLGNAIFSAATVISVGIEPRSIAAADFDVDGDLDLAVANEYDSNLSILRNNGSGVFTADAVKPSTGTGTSPFAVVAADLNADGKPDLATANFDGGTVSIFRNNGNGTFAVPTTIDSIGSGPACLAAADFDGDGKPDLAVTNLLENDLTILKNQGSMNFTAQATKPGTGTGPYYVVASDIDSDGDNDLIITNSTIQHLAVLRNNGAGQFSLPENYGVGDFPTSISYAAAMGDLDGNGTIDVAVANGEASNVSVMANTVVAGAQRVALTGTETVTGLNFGIALLTKPPTLDAISNPPAINEGAGTQMINLNGITAGSGESQQLAVTVSSSNPALIPTPTVNYASPNTTGTMSYSPVTYESGSAVITVTVTDGGEDGNLSTTQDNQCFAQIFTITVNPVNDPPMLDAISDPTVIRIDAGQQVVALSGIAAGSLESQPLAITAISNNPGLIPNPSVVYTSPGATGSLLFTPVAGQHGRATITVTVTDGGLDNNLTTTADNASIMRTFSVTVFDSPTAEDDSFNVPGNSSATVLNVLENDYADPGRTLTLRYIGMLPSHGTATIVSEQLLYTPLPGYAGPDNFTYLVSDGRALAEGQVNLLVEQIWDNSGNDVIRIVRDLTDATKANVYVNSATPTSILSLSNANPWHFNTGAGDDELVVDFSLGNPLPIGGLAFDGGTHSSGDTLSIVGTYQSDSVTMIATQLIVNGLAPIGYGNAQFFGFNLLSGQDSLLVNGVPLTINQDNAISAGTDVTVDGGTLDLNSKTDFINHLLLKSGSVVNGTLHANSYDIEGGTVTATINGPGGLQKSTTAQATTGVVNTSNVTVDAGQLTAASITTDTLTISAGAKVTITPIAGGTLGALTVQKTLIPVPVAVVDSLLTDMTVTQTTAMSPFSISPSIRNASIAEQVISDSVTYTIVETISAHSIKASKASSTKHTIDAITTREIYTASNPVLQQSSIYSPLDSRALHWFIENRLGKSLIARRVNSTSALAVGSLHDESPIPAKKIDKHPTTPAINSRLAHHTALHSNFKWTDAYAEDDFDIARHVIAGKHSKQLEKAIDEVLAEEEDTIPVEI